MYPIPIDEMHYHTNLFSEQELGWVDSVYCDTLKKYRDLPGFVQSTLSPLNLNANGIKGFMQKVLLAFCYTVKRDFSVNTREQLCKTLKKWIVLFLPVIVSNDQICRTSHCVQYEPMTLATIAFSNFLNTKSIHTKHSELAEGSFESYYLWECINFARAIRSSVLMFTTGNDVHGVCAYRGALEILSKILLAEQFPEEYVLFKNFNAYLQYKKTSDTPLPEEMISYLKSCPEYTANPENFLAYGWAKDSKGKRILTMKSLIQTALPDNEDVIGWVHLSSEFVHEDYVAVNYDYIMIRREFLKCYFMYYCSILDLVKSFYTKEERKQNGYSAIKTLFATITEMYRT